MGETTFLTLKPLKGWGFFQVINHGVLLDKHKKIKAAARKFFAHPLEEKRKITRDEKSLFGYYDTEHTKNVRDWKEVFDFTVEEPMLMPASLDPEDKEETKWTNQWPEYPPELRKASSKVDGTSSLEPRRASRQLALGVGRHKDSGALTVLAQDEVVGLEVKRKRDGEWIQVKPTPNAYIINVGFWSNDRYESVEHRVLVNSERGRFSIPYFVNPAHYTLVKPLEELAHEQEDPAKYKPYSWGKFLSHRKLSNFKKHNAENIQLYHFRVSE
ncbi:hypothetical protein Prudu_022023 [Prunus dulcis]|uniref:Fe2OG dioxygenase domain-containing protein n=1 Tax=Prunus dulcis TaxID=3755 RepID=A0A4Y1RYL1_PRUDU|nr:hypothetical protein Prudu_022023 [Prunus dulcis]